MLLNSSTRAAKLQYSQHEYWVEVALRVDENGTCTRRKWHLGWAKVALAHQKTTFLWFSRRTARAKRWRLPRFLSPEWVFRPRVLEQYLHCKLRGWRKVFTTNLMSVDLLQMARMNTLSLQKKAIRLNNQGKTMIAKDSFVPLL